MLHEDENQFSKHESVTRSGSRTKYFRYHGNEAITEHSKNNQSKNSNSLRFFRASPFKNHLPGISSVIHDSKTDSKYSDEVPGTLSSFPLRSTPSTIFGTMRNILPATATRPSLQNDPAYTYRTDDRQSSELNFEGLVQLMLRHPLFPLIFKATYDVTMRLSPSVNDKTSNDEIRSSMLRPAKIEAVTGTRQLKNMLNSEGIELFLAALLTTLSLLCDSKEVPISATLDSIIKACFPIPKQRAHGNSFANVHSTWTPYAPSFVMNTRKKLGDKAKRVLDKWFEDHYEHPYPTDVEKLELGSITGLLPNQINNYFGNRRMRLKRKILQKQKNFAQCYQGYKSSVEFKISPGHKEKATWQDVILVERQLNWHSLSRQKLAGAPCEIDRIVREGKRRRLNATQFLPC